ncbi:hypothetical protein L1887_57654 [Cichorium endivia]|nr:hypothetical protein L1887_57654 [Cichorium endivia]
MQHPLRGLRHQRYGAGKDLAAIAHCHQHLFGGCISGEGLVTASRRYLDQIITAAIRNEIGRQKPALRLSAGLEYDSAGGIGKQDRACPFRRIDTAAQYIGGNDEDGAAMGAEKAIREGQRIKKAGTGSGEIDRARSCQAQPVCQQRRRGGQEVIRRGGRKQRQCDVVEADFRVFPAPCGRLSPQGRSTCRPLAPNNACGCRAFGDGSGTG